MRLLNGDFVKIKKQNDDGDFIVGVVVNEVIVLDSGNTVNLANLNADLVHVSKPSLTVIQVFRPSDINDKSFNSFERATPPVFTGNGYVVDMYGDLVPSSAPSVAPSTSGVYVNITATAVPQPVVSVSQMQEFLATLGISLVS